jgi:hypothetical protein
LRFGFSAISLNFGKSGHKPDRGDDLLVFEKTVRGDGRGLVVCRKDLADWADAV